MTDPDDPDPGLTATLAALTPDDLDSAIRALTPPEHRRLAVYDGGLPPTKRKRSTADLHIVEADHTDNDRGECAAEGDRS